MPASSHDALSTAPVFPLPVATRSLDALVPGREHLLALACEHARAAPLTLVDAAQVPVGVLMSPAAYQALVAAADELAELALGHEAQERLMTPAPALDAEDFWSRLDAETGA